MKAKITAFSLTGRYPVNEDVFLTNLQLSNQKKVQYRKIKIKRDLTMLCVMDGINGANYGLHCSRLAASVIRKHVRGIKAVKELNLIELVNKLLDITNEAVTSFLYTKKAIGGTTINLVLIRKSEFVAANIGDTETFLLHGKNMKKISQNHTVAEMKKALGISYKKSEENLLYRYLGKSEETGSDMAHIHTGTLEKGDKILICSDGLHKVLDRETVRIYMLCDNSMELLRKRLMLIAKELPDNTTVVEYEN